MDCFKIFLVIFSCITLSVLGSVVDVELFRKPSFLFNQKKPIKQTSATCGIPLRIDGKITGGNDTTIQSYPWFAALGQYTETGEIQVSCGAALFLPDRLLTAAHCYSGDFSGSRERRFKVFFNLTNRCRDKGSEASVARVIIHKDYNHNSELPDDDIAIIVLKNPVSNMPVCLPSRASYTNMIGTIVGFGSNKVKTINKAIDSKTYPCQLQEAKVRIFSKQECKETDIGSSLARNTICAGKSAGGVDACDGDSGGPLVVNVNGIYEIVGIVSYGAGCGRANSPGVYADVTVQGHGSWINKTSDSTQSAGQSQKPARPSRPSGISFPSYFSFPWSSFDDFF